MVCRECQGDGVIVHGADPDSHEKVCIACDGSGEADAIEMQDRFGCLALTPEVRLALGVVMEAAQIEQRRCVKRAEREDHPEVQWELLHAARLIRKHLLVLEDALPEVE